MDQAHALKNQIENGTQIEYFDNGYIMQVKNKIKVYEDGKKSARALTQAQQNKLLLQARSGGIEKKRIQKPIEEEDEAVEYENETEGSQSQNEVREKPLKKRSQKANSQKFKIAVNQLYQSVARFGRTDTIENGKLIYKIITLGRYQIRARIMSNSNVWGIAESVARCEQPAYAVVYRGECQKRQINTLGQTSPLYTTDLDILDDEQD
ncbi:MAG: hypothetical protein EZS28_000336 [Streblomastix strix]|uniref:Uncharacterized protein n=1 Tax=Streblomastix strix TaxID=222440 RepID=A0A5J4XAK0_9EUKA|nr:MAG: hypothetical protein EZS28_000336 [Streblomastix strix]